MQVKTKINSAVDILVGTICGDQSLPWYNAKNNVFVNFINRFYKISGSFSISPCCIDFSETCKDIFRRQVP